MSKPPQTPPVEGLCKARGQLFEVFDKWIKAELKTKDEMLNYN